MAEVVAKEKDAFVAGTTTILNMNVGFAEAQNISLGSAIAKRRQKIPMKTVILSMSLFVSIVPSKATL